MTAVRHRFDCAKSRHYFVTQRHDTLNLALAELARSCGYLVHVESSFPAHVLSQCDAQKSGRMHCVSHSQERGALPLLRNNTRELVDVTVVRPTCLTELRNSTTSGSHVVPLTAAARAKAAKHRLYDAEYARHG